MEEILEIEAYPDNYDAAEETPTEVVDEEPDESPSVSPAPPTSEEAEMLREQISALREELNALEAMKKHSEQMLAEINEFTELFPEERIDSLPEEVWEQVKKGSSLAASFALYEKKRIASEERARGINQRNATLSAGIAGVNTPCEYFTQEQVRAMSRAEVKQNYSKIRESMKKWN